MLHILLFLLKIIGIVLVSLLGLLLFLIIIVLFVPIRYKLDVTVKGVIKGEAKVTWLLRAISFRATYVEEQLRMKLRILGRIFYDNQEPGRGKRKKGHKKRPRKERSRKKKENAEFSQEKSKEKDDTLKKLEIEQKPETSDETELMKESILEQKADTGQNTVTYQRTEESLTNQSEELLKMNDDSGKIQKEAAKILETPQVKKLETDTGVLRSKVSDREPDFDEEDLSFFEKFVRKISDKINTFFQKIRAVFQKIKDIFKSMIDGVFHIKEKIRKIRDFYYDKKNNAGILSTLRSLQNILKHIHPKRLDVEFEFGTGDPCSTGQILGILAVFFAYYGDSVKIIPNFEDVVYEGRVFCYGRIRLFTLLIICIKLKLDDNFNQMIKNFKQLKEDL
ncbi:hypothetical protein acsn021_30490 [Anaerocolumna cellulosilytica]|uniref:Uncharacterized protein n=1 Tax=Anaerocolumna cellulosilytica TaxID=433286 RepID=A0A6S6R7N4_9FIRM|nr:DUF2953 domain-containing protein [Anaerocolumna cellulosilytica]MBB5197461.1 hypothetical protein [Anaerocolumna cellulosilytica]BCJ95480.1 hypothetical protein acsn021_30490 [Anaerocolumna cellulosilytica]